MKPDIITLRRQGYKLWRIAEIVKQPQHVVAKRLIEAGVALQVQFENPHTREVLNPRTETSP